MKAKPFVHKWAQWDGRAEESSCSTCSSQVRRFGPPNGICFPFFFFFEYRSVRAGDVFHPLRDFPLPRAVVRLLFNLRARALFCRKSEIRLPGRVSWLLRGAGPARTSAIKTSLTEHHRQHFRHTKRILARWRRFVRTDFFFGGGFLEFQDGRTVCRERGNPSTWSKWFFFWNWLFVFPFSDFRSDRKSVERQQRSILGSDQYRSTKRWGSFQIST